MCSTNVTRIKSSDTLGQFMMDEAIASPLVAHELALSHVVERAIDRIGADVISGKRVVEFDILNIPIEARPGRQIAVELHRRLTNHVVQQTSADWDAAPFLPKSDIMLLFYGMIEKWKERILLDSDDLLNDWQVPRGIGSSYTFHRALTLIVNTPVFVTTGYSDGKTDVVERLSILAQTDPLSRKELCRMTLESFRYVVEKTPDRLQRGPGYLSTTMKTMIVRQLQALAETGNNPFDVFHAMYSRQPENLRPWYVPLWRV
jgi:hypothetical protein